MLNGEKANDCIEPKTTDSTGSFSGQCEVDLLVTSGPLQTLVKVTLTQEMLIGRLNSIESHIFPTTPSASPRCAENENRTFQYQVQNLEIRKVTACLQRATNRQHFNLRTVPYEVATTLLIKEISTQYVDRTSRVTRYARCCRAEEMIA